MFNRKNVFSILVALVLGASGSIAQAKGWVKVERDDGLKGWIARQLLWGW